MKWVVVDCQKPVYLFKLGKDKELGIVVVMNGKKTVKSLVRVELLASGAKVLVLGVLNLTGKSQVELTAVTDHRAANTHAETMIHGVMHDSASTNIRGLIKIRKHANQTTDFLTEKVLLLSDQAQATAEPALEIEADEVRASHAATVSTTEEEQLFYLMSRGLNKKQAEEQIVEGFLQVVMDRIKDDKIRKNLC